MGSQMITPKGDLVLYSKNLEVKTGERYRPIGPLVFISEFRLWKPGCTLSIRYTLVHAFSFLVRNLKTYILQMQSVVYVALNFW